jgi:hypothetical protein
MAKVTKKAQNGDRVTADKKGLYTRLSKYKTNDGDRFYKSTSGDIASTKDMNDFKSRTKSADSVRAADLTPAEIKHYETARRYKAGGKIIKKAQNGLRTGQYKRLGRIDEKNPARAERVAERMNTRASRVDRGKGIANPPIMRSNIMKELSDRKPEYQYRIAKENKEKGMTLPTVTVTSSRKKAMKAGGMLKRADGSYSKRGLWDNIRANKGSGKKPTSAMQKQEKKIKAKTKK